MRSKLGKLNAELFKRVQDGDESAKEEIFKLNEKFVTHILKRFNFAEMQRFYDDSFEVGRIGLWKAIETFEPEKNFEFSSYAARCIQNEILMFYRRERKNNQVLSLDDKVNDLPKDKDNVVLEDTINGTYDITDDIEARDLLAQVKYVMRYSLTPSQQKIFQLTHFDQDNRQIDVANRLGISQTYVSRIIKKARLKLKKAFELEKEGRGPFFNKGILRYSKAGGCFWVPTQELLFEMLPRNHVLRSCVNELLKNYSPLDAEIFKSVFYQRSLSTNPNAYQNFVMSKKQTSLYLKELFSSVYQRYCEYLLGEIDIKPDVKNNFFEKLPSLSKNKIFLALLKSDKQIQKDVEDILKVTKNVKIKLAKEIYFQETRQSDKVLAGMYGVDEHLVRNYAAAGLQCLRKFFDRTPQTAITSTAKNSFYLRLQQDDNLKEFAKAYVKACPTRLFSQVLEMKFLTTPSRTTKQISQDLGISMSTIYKSYNSAIREVLSMYDSGKEIKEDAKQKSKSAKSSKKLTKEFLIQLKISPEVQEFVKAYLPKLMPCLAQVFSMKYLTCPHPTNEEIAQKLNLKTSSIQVELSTAANQLREAYASAQGEGVSMGIQQNKEKFDAQASAESHCATEDE